MGKHSLNLTEGTSRDRGDVWVSLVPAIMCLAPAVPLPWNVLERELQPFVQTGATSGRDGGLLPAIVSHLLSVLSTLLCQ